MTPIYRVQLLVSLNSYTKSDVGELWMERLVSLPFTPTKDIEIVIGEFSATPRRVVYRVLDSLFVCYCGGVVSRSLDIKTLKEEYVKSGWRDRTIDSYIQESQRV